jgi:hypothetical protein
MASLFYGWRIATTYIKKRKVNRKVRAFNCLKKNIQHRKFKQDMALVADMFLAEHNKRLMRVWYNNLRRLSRISRLDLMAEVLDRDIKSSIEKGSKTLSADQI